jgi:GT2 family glycosyltransferase
MTEVSIIIPSYNHAAYIGEAVESVLNQTLRDLELIRTAGVEGLEPVFELLERALPET